MTFHLPPTISLDARHRRTALPGYRGLHRPFYYHFEIKLHHPQVILYDFLTNKGILLHNEAHHQNQEINKDALLPSKLFPLRFCQLPLYWRRTHFETTARYVSFCPVPWSLTFTCLGSGVSLWPPTYRWPPYPLNLGHPARATEPPTFLTPRRHRQPTPGSPRHTCRATKPHSRLP